MEFKDYQLQFITHYTQDYSYIDSAHIALEGGCKWVQLRMKNAPESEMEQAALVIQEMCKSCGATFIVDDNVELAKKIKDVDTILVTDESNMVDILELLHKANIPMEKITKKGNLSLAWTYLDQAKKAAEKK